MEEKVVSKEPNMLINVKAAFETYRISKTLEINDLVEKNTRFLTLTAFYKFESDFLKNKLSEDCKTAYDRNNVDNNRFNVIMELRENYLTFQNDKIVPIEVKYVIKELIEHG